MQKKLVMAGAFMAGVATLGFVDAQPANAQAARNYAWCAQYSGSDGSGGTNCYFQTRAQCMATISGVGGFCEPNPFYDSASAQRPHRSDRTRRRHHAY